MMTIFGDENVDAANEANTLDAQAPMLAAFRRIMRDCDLTPLYQPIVDLKSGAIMGYEGLIRGPANSPLHPPIKLFNAAKLYGRVIELERLCRKMHIDRFVALGLAGKLFLNMSPHALMMPVGDGHGDGTQLYPAIAGMPTENIVIELTESEAASNYAALRQAVSDYRGMGLQIAIDDLGEGFSSLRLWSEIRPEYVKIDKYFVQGIGGDAVKRQFLRSICEIARQAKSLVIAEGIETEAELEAVRSLGIQYGQGFLLARPTATPQATLAPAVLHLFAAGSGFARADAADGWKNMATARKVMRPVPVVADTVATNDVYNIFTQQPELQVLAVLRDDVPVGLIHRLRLLDRLARPYHRELYGNKPCAQFIENAPLIVDHLTSLQDLSHLFTEANPHHLSEGFIITEQGKLMGVGTGFDLIHEITEMQIHAARYANPLSQLPGNVPINEHIESLLENEEAFFVCYADLDNFKPFNDLYSYRKGDEAIQITANILREHTDPSVDFVGHIGGDDFIIVFKSRNWRDRCQRILDGFGPATSHLYKPEHVAGKGYITENRQGCAVFHPLISISLGVVEASVALPHSGHQIAEYAAQAKSEAKKLVGNSIFVERRLLG